MQLPHPAVALYHDTLYAMPSCQLDLLVQGWGWGLGLDWGLDWVMVKVMVRLSQMGLGREREKGCTGMKGSTF